MPNPKMALRPSSPSARFYTNRSAPNTPQMDQQQLTHETQATSAHHLKQFGQFQGFPAPSTRHSDVLPHSGMYDYDMREGDISPRMVIPNSVPWEATRPRPQTIVHHYDERGTRARIYQAYSAIDSGGNFNVTPDQIEAATQQWTPSHPFNTTHPSCVCVDSTDPSRHLQGDRHDCEYPVSMSYIASRQHHTFRVPSDSESSYLTGDSELSAFDEALLPDHLVAAAELAASIPSSALGEGASTIYPEDSISVTSRANEPHNGLPVRSLVDYVVVVHDICLAATQRYLESLRTNWDLRNGRPTGSGEDENSLGGRPVRNHERGPGDRWGPYDQSRPRRRAHSENHLEHMAMGTKGNQHQDGDGGHHHPVLTRKNPIPESTDSLLYNIRHICDLIWRRAQRDREDVLGAEAKACQEMCFLYECGEVIVLYNITDAARDPQACWHQLVAAGTGICRGLGDLEGLRLMELEHFGEDAQNSGEMS